MLFGSKKKKEARLEVSEEEKIQALVEAIPSSAVGAEPTDKSLDRILDMIEVKNSDLTSSWPYYDWDAIVIPQYPDRACEKGISGALLRSSHAKGIKAYDNCVKECGPFEYGTVVMTTAGRGESMIFLHVVSLGGGKERDFDNARLCTFNALQTFRKNDIGARISFPALNVDTLGTLTHEQSAQAMMKGIMEDKTINRKDSPIVYFCLYNAWVVRSFRNVIKDRSFLTADVNQPGAHDPREGCCLAVDRPVLNPAARRLNGSDKPDLT